MGVRCGVLLFGVTFGVVTILAGLGDVREILGDSVALFMETTRVRRGESVDSAKLVRYAVVDSDKCVELVLILLLEAGLGFVKTECTSSVVSVLGNLIAS